MDQEVVRRITVIPRDNWSGEGLLGADISFGFLNRLPVRKRDIANEKKAEQMKSIFGGIGANSAGYSDNGLSGREPTSEGLSSDDDSKSDHMTPRKVGKADSPR